MAKRFFLLVLVVIANQLYANIDTVYNLNNSGTGSLRTAVLYAGIGDTIVFNPALLSNGSDTLFLNTPIVLSKRITIKGLYTNSDTIYFASVLSSRLFVCNFSSAGFKNVQFDSLVVASAQFGNNGGAIYFYQGDTLRVTNSIFRNCNSGKNGGAIYAQGATTQNTVVLINNVRFNTNIALRKGGSIFTEGVFRVLIRNSFFMNCQADSGAAVASIHSNTAVTSRLLLNNCNVENNSADLIGGGVYARNIKDVRINNSWVSSNSAVKGGGAYLHAYNNNGHNTSFIALKSEFSDNSVSDEGGAIYFADGASVSLDSTIFNSNYAFQKGAGLYASQVTNYALISHSTMDSNQTTYGGGAIEVLSSKELIVNSSEFKYNSVVIGSGGGIESYSMDKIIMNNSVLQSNQGSGFYAIGCDTLMLDSITFKNNQTNPFSWGGGATIENYDSVYMNQCIFKNNSSAGYGGGLFLSALNGSTFINRSLFKNNNSISGGGGISATGGTFTHVSRLTIRNSLFHSNNTTYKGGAIGTAYGQNLSLWIDSCRISNNSAGPHPIWGAGGGISFESRFFKMTYTTLDSNSATNLGGGLFVWGADSLFIISNSTISSNSSPNGGGLYISYLPKMDLINSSVVHNSGTLGSGIYLGSGNQLYVKSSIIANNSNSSLYLGNQNFPINSLGYNIFQNQTPGAISSDYQNVNSTQLALGPLQFNGGIGLTHLPDTNSLAVNRGNPMDFSPAQNGPIIGLRRDIGAAESAVAPILGDTIDIIACDSILINSNWIVSSEVLTDTALTSQGQDSLFFTSIIIKHSYKIVDSIQACKYYTWINGTTYTSKASGDSVVLSSSAGCDSIVFLDLVINPDLSIVYNWNTLTSNALNANFQWLDCDSGYAAIPGETNALFVAKKVGSYAVEVTQNGCTDTSNCYFIDQIGWEENALGQLVVYPNPTTHKFIRIDNLPKEAVIEIYDNAGSLLRILGTSEEVVDISFLSPGTYVLHLINGTSKRITKLVVL